MKKILKYALANALGTAAYVILVATFMFIGEQGKFGMAKTVFIPIAMLMLFVFSAAFTGTLMFGRPVMWYIDGKKKEALSLLAYTLVIFFIITFIVLVLLVSYFAR